MAVLFLPSVFRTTLSILGSETGEITTTLPFRADLQCRRINAVCATRDEGITAAHGWVVAEEVSDANAGRNRYRGACVSRLCCHEL